MRLAQHLLVAAVLVLGATGMAAANTVAVLLSQDGGSYAEVAEALQTEIRRLPGAHVTIAVAGTPAASDLAALGAQLLVAVGMNAAQAAIRAPDLRVPILCVLVPKAGFDAIRVTATTGSTRTADPKRVSALYIDQPAARQFELIRQALPKHSRVGIVVGSSSPQDLERMTSAADSRGLRLSIENVEKESELFPALQRLMADTDVFLALPDARVINPETAQNLLITSYRTRTPVVAYSAAYVRAGALAAVFSTPSQMGAQAGEIARAVLRGLPLPPPQHPRLFNVVVNRQVARSLAVDVEADGTIRDRIQRAERD